MKTYSVKETAEILLISTRAVQKKCKIQNIRKKDNKYLITDEHLELWKASSEPNEPTKRTTQIGSQENLIIQSLEVEIENLKAELQFYKNSIKVKEVYTPPNPETIKAITKEFEEIVAAGGNRNILDKKIIEYEAIHRDKLNKT